MSKDNLAYFERRAFEERCAAQLATNHFAMKCHSELANRYALVAGLRRLENVLRLKLQRPRGKSPNSLVRELETARG